MEVNSTQLALKLAARKALIIRSSGYLVALNEKFLTQLASDLLLQIEQVLRLIGIRLTQIFFVHYNHATMRLHCIA
ncbi:hypothetical protein FX995_07640 [Pseudoalteromonas flavipulchra]|uniref:Uncharacterized protein n=1 Tax=Pseudoalteromonas maricaloris TaxID=184924 RepID=A0A8I2KLD2_9GAMM|nr:hypothetical protein [Pseudoalteromonas flavipulchra]MBE0372509.1 hypothetical protein [Pseudoalteromonas flavipulchra NCIMB 2033 = ATCC BAA-314]NLR21499.1 hypothetical protein [Pseudoalteromonas maricaloris]RZG15502.1 hypothetical protein EXT47_09790 [Pseudoalteromonas sp. CO342X]